jgi:ATP-dependent DNA helicase PIF1
MVTIKKSPFFHVRKGKMEDILTSQQKEGWKILDSSENVFLTGDAGTGKTFLINTWINSNILFSEISVVASTGMAAVLLNGRTFHSFFGLGLAKGKKEKIIFSSIKNKKVRQNIIDTDILIIDEISMISGKLLDIANEICKKICYSSLPWGGMQIITIGDFAQLPPISEDNKIDWCFKSRSWFESNFKNIILTENIRSNNEEFKNFLNKIRYNKIDKEVKNFIFDKEINIKDADNFEGTRLFPIRKKVNEYNKKKLDEIPENEIIINTVFSGDPKYLEKFKKSIPIDEVLYIKKGALVMVRINDNKNFKYVNGTLARVIDYNIERQEITLEYLKTGETFLIKKHTFEWVDKKENKTLAKGKNFPICLAWASTIHKSQGASIDSVLIDMENLWDYGQAYVALSRSSNPDNLRILNPSIKSIKCSPEVINFYNFLKGH